jgi:cobalt-zinc-cadmium efflux system membrane fusion protein
LRRPTPGWAAPAALLLGLLVPGATPAEEAEGAAADAAVIEVGESLEARLVTAPAELEPLRRRLRLPASVELDQTRVSRIDAGVNGRILDVYAFGGGYVEAGDRLAQLTSPELTQAQVALLGALAEVDLQRRAVQRASDLVDAEVISQAELERRQKQLFVAQMAVQSHRDQLRLMGMSQAEVAEVERTRTIHSEVVIGARRAGTVIERNVNRSQVVQPGDPLFSIADLSRLRVEGQAPEREVDFLAGADHVEVELPALGGEQILGRLVYVGATVNPTTRTVTVRTEIDSPSGHIKPEMLATLVVVGPLERKLAVPAAAVVRDGLGDHVFVREAPGRYRFTDVALEPSVDDLRPVSTGLAEGDVVVVKGAFRLNSERLRRARP